MDQATSVAATPSSPQRVAQPTIDGSVYVKPQEIAWEPTQFEGISIKVLYEDKARGKMDWSSDMIPVQYLSHR